MTIPFTLSTTMDALPWQPVKPGFDIKVIRGVDSDDDTIVELLRLEPGTEIARHRHTGEVHAFNLAGSRELTETGEIVGPGAYVYEPPGNVDSWRAVGDAPVVVLVTVRGAIEYLDDEGRVLRTNTNSAATRRYAEYCASLSNR
jgi:quercetin dioxygenase-like cupin family protein